MSERLYKLAVASNRYDKVWRNVEMSFSEFCAHLAEPIVARVTMEEYRSLAKPSQSDIKDKGGYVGGVLVNGIRRNGMVSARSLVTLDYDRFTPEQLARLQDRLKCAWAVHSTMKHTETDWRCRVVVALSRDVTCDEYGAVARRVAEEISFEGIDCSTFEPVRLMFWPVRCKDAPFLFKVSDYPEPLDVDTVLGSFQDWRDMTQWPMLPVEEAALGSGMLPGDKRPRTAAELFAGRGNGGFQEDPTTKKGLVGLFCRTYDIHRAIETFLPNVYSKSRGNRYSHTGSSTSGGALVLEEGKFFYSFHGTDPLQGRLLNSFDLVRNALFGAADANCGPDTRVSRLPSWKKMEELAKADKEISERSIAEKLSPDRFKDFELKEETPEGTEPEKGFEIPEWQRTLARLSRDKNEDILEEPYNVKTVLLNDPRFAGKVIQNLFSGTMEVVGDLPWKREDTKAWQDSDDDALLCFLNQWYKFKKAAVVRSSMNAAILETACHPVRDYLDSLKWDGVPRLEGLFVDLIGADNTRLNKSLARLIFTAAVRRIYRPGEKFDYFIILKGPEKCGKSSVFEIMGGDWYNNSITGIDGKTGMESLQGTWIGELAELVAVKKKDAEVMKSFISSTVDKFRPAYGRRMVSRPRQCVLVGTTNENSFLSGIETGNRRSPVVVCKPELRTIKEPVREYLEKNRDQLWAEAKHFHETGMPIYLDDSYDKEIEAIQGEFNRDKQNPIFGEVDRFLDMWLPSGAPTGNAWDTLSGDATPWCGFKLEDRRTWLRQHAGYDFHGAAGHEPRVSVCMPEILQEFLGMERTDAGYMALSRSISSHMATKKGEWIKKGNARHPLYGVQMTWTRIQPGETGGGVISAQNPVISPNNTLIDF